MSTTFDRTEFYSRQMVLADLGPAGQEKLSHSKVVVVGLGGLGSTSALFLALAGIGTLVLVDQDTVEMNNLHRQVLYSLRDLRYPKVEAAARRINEINPETRVEAIPENLNVENVEATLNSADCVVDGLDNMDTRYLINRLCVQKRIPFVFGGAIGMEGNVAVFRSPETPCLECVMPGLNDATLPTCEARGIVGATTGIVGAVQAMETVKMLAGIDIESRGKLMVFDFVQDEFRTLELAIRPDCGVCQKQGRLDVYPKRLAWLCGSDTANVNPQKPLSLDLEGLASSNILESRILLKTPMVIVFDYDGHEVSLFRKGRMLIKNVRNEDEALVISKAIVKIIGAA